MFGWRCCTVSCTATSAPTLPILPHHMPPLPRSAPWTGAASVISGNTRMHPLLPLSLCPLSHPQRAMGEFGAVSVISGNIIGQTQTLTLYVESAYKVSRGRWWWCGGGAEQTKLCITAGVQQQVSVSPPLPSAPNTPLRHPRVLPLLYRRSTTASRRLRLRCCCPSWHSSH